MRHLRLLCVRTHILGLSALFIVTTLVPVWATEKPSGTIKKRSATITMQEAPLDTAPVAPPGSLRDAVRRAAPSVVNIYARKPEPAGKHPIKEDPHLRSFFDGIVEQIPENFSSVASGVIISKEGHILTNHHALQSTGGTPIAIVLPDGRRAEGKIIASDPETDLGLIQIDLADLPVITLGHMEQAHAGDVVLTMGYPFGMEQAVNMGVISALGKSAHGALNLFQNFIQTDAVINAGNSGGALVDAHGNLLGISTASFGRNAFSPGISLAVPVSTIKAVVKILVHEGKIVRGDLGLDGRDITPDMAQKAGLDKTSGVFVTNVKAEGPAHKAGIVTGDVVLFLDGKEVNNTIDFFTRLTRIKPTTQTRVVIWRDKKKITLDTTVGHRSTVSPYGPSRSRQRRSAPRF